MFQKVLAFSSRTNILVCISMFHWLIYLIIETNVRWKIAYIFAVL